MADRRICAPAEVIDRGPRRDGRASRRTRLAAGGPGGGRGGPGGLRAEVGPAVSGGGLEEERAAAPQKTADDVGEEVRDVVRVARISATINLLAVTGWRMGTAAVAEDAERSMHDGGRELASDGAPTHMTRTLCGPAAAKRWPKAFRRTETSAVDGRNPSTPGRFPPAGRGKVAAIMNRAVLCGTVDSIQAHCTFT